MAARGAAPARMYAAARAPLPRGGAPPPARRAATRRARAAPSASASSPAARAAEDPANPFAALTQADLKSWRERTSQVRKRARAPSPPRRPRTRARGAAPERPRTPNAHTSTEGASGTARRPAAEERQAAPPWCVRGVGWCARALGVFHFGFNAWCGAWYACEGCVSVWSDTPGILDLWVVSQSRDSKPRMYVCQAAKASKARSKPVCSWGSTFCLISRRPGQAPGTSFRGCDAARSRHICEWGRSAVPFGPMPQP